MSDSSNLQANIAARHAAVGIMEMLHSAAGVLENPARYWQLLHEEICKQLPPSKDGPAMMTNAQAAAFERQLMPFGVHRGMPIALVPLEYLDWLLGESDPFKEKVRLYLANKRISLMVQQTLDD